MLLSRESRQGFQAPPPLEAALGCKLHLGFVGNAKYAVTAGMTRNRSVSVQKAHWGRPREARPGLLGSPWTGGLGDSPPAAWDALPGRVPSQRLALTIFPFLNRNK